VYQIAATIPMGIKDIVFEYKIKIKITSDELYFFCKLLVFEHTVHVIRINGIGNKIIINGIIA
jgi:hypothetical protein